MLHSPLCLPIRDRDKYNTHNKHISDKQKLMTVCVRNGTPFDGVHAPQSLKYGLLLPTPFSFRCGHATSTSHRIKFTYILITIFNSIYVASKLSRRNLGFFFFVAKKKNRIKFTYILITIFNSIYVASKLSRRNLGFFFFVAKKKNR
jgi:hypothetical protein